jgi:four helix bundle protein
MKLTHKNLEVYKVAGELLNECYITTKYLPPEEKFNLTQQIKRAALSVLLNVAEGSSRSSILERKRFFEIARGSIVEIDTAFTASVILNYTQEEQLNKLNTLLISCFRMLSKMIKTLSETTK